MDRPGRRVIRPVGIFVAQSNRCQWQPCRSSGRGKAEEGVLLIQLDCPSPRKVDFVQRLKAAILGFVGSVRSTSSWKLSTVFCGWDALQEGRADVGTEGGCGEAPPDAGKRGRVRAGG